MSAVNTPPLPPPPPPVPARAASPVSEQASQPDPSAESLWRALSVGTASPGVRAAVNLALAAGLGGLVPILAYCLAAMNSRWNRNSGFAVYPRDELLGFIAAIASGAFLAGTAWIWSRSGRRRAVLTPVVLTIAALMATILLGVLADENLPGDSELVVGGLVALGGAAVILIWVRAYCRRGPTWRALNNRQDGLPDVRCPACDYRMVGLTESRCPECGAAYTLDELIAKQGFGPVGNPAQGPGQVRALRSA